VIKNLNSKALDGRVIKGEKMQKLQIGVIGFGYVGQAVHYLLSKKYEIKIFDIDVNKKTHDK
jgi:lactate dehydrogenase-like 2-hydroxyacid dehydrogenase